GPSTARWPRSGISDATISTCPGSTPTSPPTSPAMPAPPPFSRRARARPSLSLHVLVLAGGSGTRLWPLSRVAQPKHLLPLGSGGQTLLRSTLERVAGIGDDVHVVTAAAQAEAC